ncbi:MAG: carotenoid oxygenase family protein, partial [Chloroflexota bacterium]
KPGANAEDEGWVATFAHDEREGQSSLLILNAQDFDGEPQARINMPVRVPYGFHGAWIAEDELAE